MRLASSIASAPICQKPFACDPTAIATGARENLNRTATRDHISLRSALLFRIRGGLVQALRAASANVFLPTRAIELTKCFPAFIA
jgi:hypothetical protein